MVSFQSIVLMEDGTIKTYEYNGDHDGLLQWMSQKTPQDIDHPSPYNYAELLQNCHQPVTAAPHGQDPLMHQGDDLQSPIFEQYPPPCIILLVII
jgi:hypothetical protein